MALEVEERAVARPVVLQGGPENGGRSVLLVDQGRHHRALGLGQEIALEVEVEPVAFHVEHVVHSPQAG